jgi:hypothetical protein
LKRRRVEPQLPHREKQPAVNRLQPVAGIRQAPVHDGGQRVSEIALLQRLAQRDLLDVIRFGGIDLFPWKWVNAGVTS